MRAYAYNWVYTIAQIELILADKPLVLYKDTKDKSAGGKAPTANEAEDAYQQWLVNKEKNKGQKLKLNDWIKNG